MIDISKLSGESLEQLADAYIHATIVFGVVPLEASGRKQRKIRKWLSKQYAEPIWSLPEDARLFSPEHSDREVLSLLEACRDRVRALTKEREDRSTAVLATLDPASADALQTLLQLDFWPEIRPTGPDIRLLVDESPAFRRYLTLKNTDAVPQQKEGYNCQALGLRKEGDRLCLCGVLMDPVEETSEPFAMTFESAEPEVQIFNACVHPGFTETPWDLLWWICHAIKRKAELPGDHCNEKEKALLPLIREIGSLVPWPELSGQERLSLHGLEQLTAEYGLLDAGALLRKLEALSPDDAAFRNALRKLTSILCKQKSAPLWRDLYHLLVQSQAGYPNIPDPSLDGRSLAEVRHEIQRLMEHRGYTGTYPDFVKKGALKGLHLERAYDMDYFVGMSKRARFHIHCAESCEADLRWTIQFLCGTALLKKGEGETDIYSCMFDAKGRRLFRTVYHHIPLEQDGDLEEDDLETSVRIAVKKAECVKLDKVEQKIYHGALLPGWGMFWWIFLVAGGLFGIAMTLSMMIICIVITALFGLGSQIPEMLMEMPWGLLLAIGWVGFGTGLGITTVLSLRK